ncbi:MAG TPA: VWA domain-containing protein [Chloroflexi bacterium]|nr:VWA domain-containing protein [Chloroflexota bacterium]
MTGTAIVPGSLTAIARQQGASLAEAFVNVDAVVIVDVSGSMAAKDSRGGKSRYEVMLEELAALQANLPGRVAVVAFSDAPVFVPGGQPPLLGGTTDMAAALRFVKPADVAGVRFIMVSDGEPNDPGETLAVARTFQQRIDAIYVGPEEHPLGRDFLQRLTEASGGQTLTAALVQNLALETARLMLTDGR